MPSTRPSRTPPPADWADDRVHPDLPGHAVIARAFLETFHGRSRSVSALLNAHHLIGDSIIVSAGDVEILRYVYRGDPATFEAPKPYAHPLRTLAGHVVTGYRPHDHRWHKGLQMTASVLSGQNFWGGGTYVHGQGYLDLPDVIGTIDHDGFDVVDARPDRVDLVERLSWRTYGEELWALEKRGLAVHSVNPDEGTWILEWSIELRNVHHASLRFGSPATQGRDLAGYTGLHWRGPRDFVGGDVLGPETGGRGEAGAVELMGTAAPWLAFTGRHDSVDAESTLIFVHAPENDEAIHSSHWFVRSEPFPTVTPSWAFHEEFDLPSDEALIYRYRIVVADGAWDRNRIERYLGRTTTTTGQTY